MASHLSVDESQRRVGVTSPLPTPDQRAFDHTKLVGKKHHHGPRKSCPSPPAKSPPVSRLFQKRRELYSPNAKMLAVGGSLSSSVMSAQERSMSATPQSIGLLSPDMRHMFASPMDGSMVGMTTEGSIFDNEFVLLGTIGSGSFAEVYKVEWLRDHQIYAIKKSRHPFRGLRDRERAMGEVESIARLSNEHCVAYHRAWEEQGYLYIQMEWCAQGSLRDFADEHDVLSEEEVWHVLIDVVLGLDHIHNAGLLHLDIKPDNIFLDAAGTLKIGDFGLAMNRSSGSLDLEGDPAYLPDELLRNDDRPVGPASDIYSLGATMYEIAADIEMPRGGQLWHDLREGKVPRAPMDEHKRSAELQEVILWMMHPNPGERPMTSDLLAWPPLRQRLLHERHTHASAGVGSLREKIQLFCEPTETAQSSQGVLPMQLFGASTSGGSPSAIGTISGSNSLLSMYGDDEDTFDDVDTLGFGPIPSVRLSFDDADDDDDDDDGDLSLRRRLDLSGGRDDDDDDDDFLRRPSARAWSEMSGMSIGVDEDSSSDSGVGSFDGFIAFGSGSRRRPGMTQSQSSSVSSIHGTTSSFLGEMVAPVPPPPPPPSAEVAAEMAAVGSTPWTPKRKKRAMVQKQRDRAETAERREAWSNVVSTVTFGFVILALSWVLNLWVQWDLVSMAVSAALVVVMTPRSFLHRFQWNQNGVLVMMMAVLWHCW